MTSFLVGTISNNLNKQLAHMFQPLFTRQLNIKEDRFQMDLISLNYLKIAKIFGMQIY